MPHCPVCSRTFDVAGGFCPFDGETLKVGSPESAEPHQGIDDAMALLKKASPTLAKGPPNLDDLVGTDFDNRYRITGKLGEGAMGVVFRAEHNVIHKAVAIKVLRPEMNDPKTAERFVREARATSKIGHPNIVDITDFGRTKDQLCYHVMEYLDGETLDKVIHKHKTLRFARSLPIITQIAEALSAAHDNGIVHRDLKPENVFLVQRAGRDDFVKIVDFGVAKIHTEAPTTPDGQRLTQIGAVYGTPEYMSPEQAAGRADVDLRADVYSLGVMLFEMLTGRLPFVGKSQMQLISLHMFETPPTPREVNPDCDVDDAVEAVIMRVLAKKPEDRYPSMPAFVEALGRASKLTTSLSKRMSLPALPPGATAAPVVDVVDMTASDTRPDVHPPVAITSNSAEPTLQPERRRRESTHDPVFVARGKAVFALDEANLPASRQPPAPASKLPTIIVAVVAVLALGAGAFVLFGNDGAQAVLPDTTAPLPRPNTTPTALAPASTPASPEVTADAAPAQRVDPIQPDTTPGTEHTKKRAATPKNAPSRKRPPRSIGILRVLASPAGTDIFIGGKKVGTTTHKATGKIGDKAVITCGSGAARSDAIRVQFTKQSRTVTCHANVVPSASAQPDTTAPKGKCVDALKNPFAKCD